MEVFLSKYQQAERRLEALAEEMARLEKDLRDLPPDSELAKEKREQLQKLAEQMREDAEAVRESAKHLLPYDPTRN
jgi:hypothetical protein